LEGGGVIEADGNDEGDAVGKPDGRGVGLPNTYVGASVGLKEGVAVGRAVG